VDLSNCRRALYRARATPVDPLQKIAELGRRDRHRLAAPACRPKELPRFKPHGVRGPSYAKLTRCRRNRRQANLELLLGRNGHEVSDGLEWAAIIALIKPFQVFPPNRTCGFPRYQSVRPPDRLDRIATRYDRSCELFIRQLHRSDRHVLNVRCYMGPALRATRTPCRLTAALPPCGYQT
jgi:hypothetical protein